MGDPSLKLQTYIMANTAPDLSVSTMGSTTPSTLHPVTELALPNMALAILRYDRAWWQHTNV